MALVIVSSFGQKVAGSAGRVDLSNPNLDQYSEALSDTFFTVLKQGMRTSIIGTALCLLIGTGPALLAAGIHAVMYVFVLSSSINGLCHHVGYRNFDNTATNIRTLALLTGGEGLHNNHLGFPRSPKFSFKASEIDPAWPIIKLLISLNLAKPSKTIHEIAA